VKILRIDEIEPSELDGTRWKPIRSTLGIESFGINAYEALRPGNVVFNEHDETESLAGRQRHEELYLVMRGRATFTVDGTEIDAPVGTLVFVDDPASRRGAVATESGTVVLALGGPVGEPYEPAPWERKFLEERAR
jgi:hypothetical protein